MTTQTYPRSFSHIGISVPDLEAAVKFYTEVLGWYLIMEPTEIVEDDSAIGEMCTDVFGRVGSVFVLLTYQRVIVLALSCLNLKIKPTLKITLSTGKQAFSTSVFKIQMWKTWQKRLWLLVVRNA